MSDAQTDKQTTEPPEWERAPCPRCGAVTSDEAAGKCRPERDCTDEYVCPGEEADAEGFLIQRTQASLDADAEHYEQMAREEGWI